jgi:carboxylate-amine ligase
VRLQPRYGTVEVRIMDGQACVGDVTAVAALIQTLVSVEFELRDDSGPESRTVELIEENRFRAARDGMAARLIDLRSGRRVAAIEQLERILGAWRCHAGRLGCERELALVHGLVRHNGAERQLAHAAGGGDLRGVIALLADVYRPPIGLERAVTAVA